MWWTGRLSRLPEGGHRADPGSSGLVLSGTTERDDGDYSISAARDRIESDRRGLVDLPWVWLTQVHGSQVVEVSHSNAAETCGDEADAMVTRDAGLVLSVQTADCAPVMFSSVDRSVIGLAHAGWRGILAGVIQSTIEAMDAPVGEARIGPFIHASCYEFGEQDLDLVASRLGDQVRSTTDRGAPALDVWAAVATACSEKGVRLVDSRSSPADHSCCTACNPSRFYSHRARGEAGRMTTAIWRAT